MIVLGYFENRQQAINQLIALGQFDFAFKLIEYINNEYEDFT